MTKITYNGKTTDVPSGYIATIPCKDFKMATDVVVEAPESEGKEPNLISKTITENGTYKINEKSALGTWRLNSDFKITSVIDVKKEIEGTFVAVAEDGTIQELPLRHFRLNTFDDGNYGTFCLETSRLGFPASHTTIFDHKQTIRLETYGVGGKLLYDQKDIPLDSELGEQLRYFTITNVGAMHMGTEEALTEWLYANCTKIAKIDGYSEVIVNVEPALEEITITENGEYTPSVYGYSKVTVNIETIETEEWDGIGVIIAPVGAEDELLGTWIFNDILSLNGDTTYKLNYHSNGQTFTSLKIEGDILYYINSDIETYAYDNFLLMWDNDAYKTITITSKLYEVTNGSTLLAWLKANATKQAEATAVLSIYHNTGDGPTYTFNVPSANGTWYSLDGIVSNESPKISLQIPPSSGDISLLDSTSANGQIAFIRLDNSYIDGSANYNVENYYTYSTWTQAGAGN